MGDHRARQAIAQLRAMIDHIESEDTGACVVVSVRREPESRDHHIFQSVYFSDPAAARRCAVQLRALADTLEGRVDSGLQSLSEASDVEFLEVDPLLDPAATLGLTPIPPSILSSLKGAPRTAIYKHTRRAPEED